MGDRRLDLARPGPRVPAQPVADDDPLRAARPSSCSTSSAASTASAGSRSRRRRSGWEELHRRLGRARSFGLPASLLGPEQVRSLVPLIDPERILGGLHTPTDGIAKALRAAEAMATASGAARVRRLRGHRLRGRARRDPRRAHVARHDPHDTVVLAAGIWGPKVARAGRRPAAARPRPAPVRGHRAAARARRRDARGRRTRSSATRTPTSTSARSATPTGSATTTTSRGSSSRGTSPRPAGRASRRCCRSRRRTSRARRRRRARLLPAVGRAPLARSFDGLMSFTPDGMPLIGEAAAARGLWLCEAIWVTHSGGAGRALAELIVRGDVRTDLHECDPQRFDAHGLSRTYARLRGAQQYREVYDVLHPRQQQEQVRLLRRTPLHPRQLELGAHLLRERRLGAAAVVRGQRGARPRRDPAAPRLAGARVVADRRRRAPRLPRAGRALRPDAVHQGRGPRPGRARLPPRARRQRRRPPGRHDRLHRDVRAARRDHVRPDDHAHGPGDASSSSPAARSAATTSRG